MRGAWQIIDLKPRTDVNDKFVRLPNTVIALPIGPTLEGQRATTADPSHSDKSAPAIGAGRGSRRDQLHRIERGMTGLAAHLKPNPLDITSALADYILSQHPSKCTRETLPHDESLLELGVLDLAGVMDSRAAKRTTRAHHVVHREFNICASHRRTNGLHRFPLIIARK